MRNVALVSVSALILGFGGSSMSGRDKPWPLTRSSSYCRSGERSA